MGKKVLCLPARITHVPGDMTFVEQISIAQRATVTFSPCGGISFFNAFLREGATAIISDIWDTALSASADMDGYFCDRTLSGHRTLRYTVEENDILIEPPRNATAKGWRDYRDFGATILDVGRALRVIDEALYTARHVFQLEKPEPRND